MPGSLRTPVLATLPLLAHACVAALVSSCSPPGSEFDGGLHPVVVSGERLATVLATGDRPLIGVHVAPAGVIVVSGTWARLYARTGAQLVEYVSPRAISASDFDGTYLALADTAAVVALEVPSFKQHSSVFVTEACASGALLSGHRFVCSPASDYDRTFRTYDVSTGTLIGASGPFWDDGIPMRKVPGWDAFVVVGTNVVPADFTLFRVDASNAMTHGPDDLYHGDFKVSESYAFRGLPATDVVTEEGHYLHISATCGSGTNEPCFQREGELGGPAPDERFLLMTEEGDGKHIDVVAATGGLNGNYHCTGFNCAIRRFNTETHAQESATAFVNPFDEAVLMRFDPIAHRVILGHGPGCVFQPTIQCTSYGFEVEYARFE
jgi:hypothetical protein